ncbi:TPA: antirestriction protein ArdA [Listeria monocytogenes]|nr:antirestriction protein ArdA [Listeria monocytogenes]
MDNIEICVKNGKRSCWFTLPESLETIYDALDVYVVEDTLLISDYKAPFKINETDNIDRLNDIANLYELNASHPAIDFLGGLTKDGIYSDIESALEDIGNIMIYEDCNSMLDVAYAYIEETGLLSNMPGNISRYFNYEAYANDLDIEGTFLFTGRGFALRIF